jgi:aldehyde dehydrogenase (NAD+)
MYGDDPATSDSYARIVNERHTRRLAELIDSGSVAIGGQVDFERRYIAPTVLTGVGRDSAVMAGEIFGPILPIVRVSGLDDALAFVRGGDKPLASYLFTTSKEAEQRFTAEISSGSAGINDVLMFHAVPELPFGGVGASGMGCYSGEHGFRTFSHFKAVLKRSWWPDVKLRYAPYTKRALGLIRKLS